MIEWIPHDDGGRVPPETIGRAVRAMEWPTSDIIVETGKYISIDFVPVGQNMETDLYHFIRQNDKWLPRMWNELDDEHRLLVRTHPREFLYKIGEYKDSRYLVLEALT